MSERLSHRAIRQRELQRSRKEIADTKRYEASARTSGHLYFGGAGSMYDSPLDIWEPNGELFETTFSKVLPEKYQETGGLKRYIEEVLAPKKGSAVGLELGGPGSQLFRGFSSEFFNKTAGICLVDSRNTFNRSRDEENHHSLLLGDILSQEGKQAADTWAGGKKIDLLFLRMAGPRGSLPNEPFFMAQEAAFWYPYISEIGLIIAQLPFAFDHTIEQWVDDINAGPDALEAQTDKNPYLDGANLRLLKLPGAPGKLPPLDARTVLRQQRVKGNYSGTNRRH